MQRERSEIIVYTKDDLERIVRHMAQMQIIGHLFIGKFGEQEIRWNVDGGVEVITKYLQGGYEDLPAVTQEVASLSHKKKNNK